MKIFFLYGRTSNGAHIDQLSLGAQVGAVFMASKSVGSDVGFRFQQDTFSSNGISISGGTIWLGAGIVAFVW
jgi:hypothetical protein